MASPLAMSLTDLRAAIASRAVSAEEATRASLAQIERIDPKLRCFLQTFPDRALARARDIDRAMGSGAASPATPGGAASPLLGVPIALKDNICCDFGRTTCASRILEHYESPYSATVTRRLEAAGAIIVGKTNLDEFAMGSSTENSAFHPTGNAWDPTRVPGGSSGGSASAVAARMVSGAFGSDTGGSIRQPAGLSGLVGVKTTYGRVSRYGLVAFASSLDQIGPFARSVPDAAALLDVICAHDPLDSTSAPNAAPGPADGGSFSANLDTPVKGLRVAVPKEARSDQNHPAMAAAFEFAVETFRSLGATIVDIELPHLSYGIAAYYIIAPAEASSNLARYDGVRYGRRAELKPAEDLIALYSRSRAEGFGAEVQRRIMLGTHVLSSGYYDAYYTTALRARRLIKQDFDNAFAPSGPGAHVVLMPSTTGPAFRIGEKANDPLALYLEDIYTVTANLAGIGALSMPAGFAPGAAGHAGDLPLGVQLFCAPFDEGRMLRIARMFERATDHARRAPEIAGV